MLWSEIWNCQETKRNGRNGQNQHGVDISGIPSWERAEYYGIQCKGKDEYTHAQLTVTEVEKEIEKAKKFKPQLKKFYFATTANKDATIEEYIRLKNIESIKADSFEIHLFCWEEIVTLIDQNKKTHDWYVRKIKFNTQYDVSITFDNDSVELPFNPILVRNQVTYQLNPPKPTKISYLDLLISPPEKQREDELKKLIDPQPIEHYIDGTTYNKSSCEFAIKIKNIGSSVLENYKLYFQLIGEIIASDTTNKQRMMLDSFKYTYDTYCLKEENSFVFEPSDIVLVQNDSVTSDKVCLRPSENIQIIKLNWKLVARDFTKEGELLLNINPKIKDKISVETYDYKFPDEVRIENYFGYED